MEYAFRLSATVAAMYDVCGLSEPSLRQLCKRFCTGTATTAQPEFHAFGRRAAPSPVNVLSRLQSLGCVPQCVLRPWSRPNVHNNRQFAEDRRSRALSTQLSCPPEICEGCLYFMVAHGFAGESFINTFQLIGRRAIRATRKLRFYFKRKLCELLLPFLRPTLNTVQDSLYLVSCHACIIPRRRHNSRCPTYRALLQSGPKSTA